MILSFTRILLQLTVDFYLNIKIKWTLFFNSFYSFWPPSELTESRFFYFWRYYNKGFQSDEYHETVSGIDWKIKTSNRYRFTQNFLVSFIVIPCTRASSYIDEKIIRQGKYSLNKTYSVLTAKSLVKSEISFKVEPKVDRQAWGRTWGPVAVRVWGPAWVQVRGWTGVPVWGQAWDQTGGKTLCRIRSWAWGGVWARSRIRGQTVGWTGGRIWVRIWCRSNWTLSVKPSKLKEIIFIIEYLSLCIR